MQSEDTEGDTQEPGGDREFLTPARFNGARYSEVATSPGLALRGRGAQMEHRWGKRTPVDVAVKLYMGSGTVFAGHMINASLSGALVRTDARMLSFSRLIVELEHPGHSPATQAIFAYVARQAGDGLGLEWTEFAPPAIVTLLTASNVAHAEAPGVVTSGVALSAGRIGWD